MTGIGRQFEDDFAEQMGLQRVPGSGNQWHSKMDVRGKGALWSLKATKHASFSLKHEDWIELLTATYGMDGDGRVPFMAIRIYAEDDPIDLVVMTTDDFRAIASGDYQYVQESRVEAKRRRADIPELLREEGD